MVSANYQGCFGDKRLERRGLQLHRRLFEKAIYSIQALAQSRAEQKAFYRFLHSDKTCEDQLIVEVSERCAQASRGKIVLCIQDTTDLDLHTHSGRIHTPSGIWDIGNQCSALGFKLHPSLVVDAGNGFPLGFSDILIWNRAIRGPNKSERAYKKLPVEQKESYKWINASEQSKRVLSGAAAVIVIQDREGDIFEQLVQVPDEKTFLLIRSQINRPLTAEAKLWDRLSTATLLGHYELELSADARRKAPARTAIIEVRCVEAELACPAQDKKNRGKVVRVQALEAKEVIPEGGVDYEPIHWRLLTTWPLESYEDILQVIEWYCLRWLIEGLFRMLKKEGFNIEASELENPWAIRKLTVMMLDVLVKLMQMHIAYNTAEEGEELKADTTFSSQEQQCLCAVNPKWQGKTKALQNPYAAHTLKWAVWIVARIGGWKGYSSQRPPGMTTLFKGLEKFYQVYEGWTLPKDVGTR